MRSSYFKDKVVIVTGASSGIGLASARLFGSLGANVVMAARSYEKLLGLAPLFDHNMALISRGYPKAPKKSDLLIRLFNDLLDNHPQYKEYLPEVSEEVIRNTIADLHMRVRTNDIVGLIMGRYVMINKDGNNNEFKNKL